MSFSAGGRVDRYEVIGRVGVGGMAEVYAARVTLTTGVRRLVALKRLLPAYAGDGEMLRLFTDEARTSALLQHPNIAQVFAVGDEAGEPYFAMEYVEGTTVRALVAAANAAGEPIALEHVMSIGVQTASALRHAHEKGVVHRDVSASNVLVSYDGCAKLVDFGIAKAAARASLTRAGTVRGNPLYMSPEQSTGDTADARSDVFSLGLVLYLLVTGRPPFDGDSPVAVAARLALVDVPPPSALRTSLPRPIEDVLLRALRRDRDQRFQSAEALQLALEDACRAAGIAPSSAALSRYLRALVPHATSAFDSLEPLDPTANERVTDAIATGADTRPARARRVALLGAAGVATVAAALGANAAFHPAARPPTPVSALTASGPRFAPDAPASIVSSSTAIAAPASSALTGADVGDAGASPPGARVPGVRGRAPRAPAARDGSDAPVAREVERRRARARVARPPSDAPLP